ncbi:hypothetical protein H310_01957 [Aphanomyces invadans]|uniref:Ubiquitin-like domain-containing protein n=1 Tax=Aphanomyces invadans TaxID=157072 RepID=A0A024UPB8_9STRA|nr:hypothetical protein H310_01957 [Aphanomyces invadans]ETW07443.1 hypothetical protein H310_01957 [Aphanomyces invadans]|eukprot:XP_008863536.1 hypothetical protein H310_01957 [Aphanomyces invadans]
MATAIEVAAMEAIRAANEFASSDHSGTKSPTQRPQTAVGPRERLEKATATFYRKHHTAADGAATIAPALTGISPGAASRSCRTIQAWLTGETHAESLRHMQTQVDNDTKALLIKSSNDVALPFDFSQPDLQLLRDALKDRTTMYLRDLYQSFRAFRQSIMSNSSLSPQLDAMFQSSHRFHAQADVLAQLFPGHSLDKGRQTEVASLSKHHVMLMLTHCDTDGNSSVDMHVFLHLVQTVAASRETLLSNVFQAIALHAALDNKSANASHPDRVLRILKLVSMVRDVEALKQSRPDTGPVIAWLQSHTAPTMTRLAWMQFHRVQSDRFDSDADFVLFLDNVWGFLTRRHADIDDDAMAHYKSLLARRADVLAASHALCRRGKLCETLANTIAKVDKINQDLMTRAKTMTTVALSGHQLHTTSTAVVEKVVQTLAHVTVVTIMPLASTVPEAFVCAGAVELDVSNVGLTALPTSLGRMVHLHKLLASHNQLTTLPASAAHLVHLTHVNLSGNKLSVVPAVMEHWKDVNEVNLAANNLVSVPDILFRHWPKLTSLTLHDNRLAALPEALGTCCTNLSVLLCHRNCLTSLPSTVAQLVKLTVATWHHNHLDNIFQTTDSTKATSLQRLESVTTFTLAHNRLRHVPAAAAFTSLKVLRVCDLSHNDLHDIQDVDFSTLVACVEVNLRRNRLVHLPSSIFRMANLVHLSVQGNVLVALPQEMATAPSLETVLAHTNHIAKLPTVLNRTLRLLDVSHNRITTIPLTWATSLSHRTHGATGPLVLQTLKLDDNPLENDVQHVVDTQAYTCHAHVALTTAIRKLVDYVQRTTTHRSKADFTTNQRASTNDRKTYSLRVRKGRGKVATEYVDWAFRDVATRQQQQNGATVSAVVFRRILMALGTPWTSLEWHHILHEFQLTGATTTTDAQVDVERFLKALEGIQSPKASTSFAEGLLMCLLDKAPKSKQHQPPPAPTMSAKTSPPATATTAVTMTLEPAIAKVVTQTKSLPRADGNPNQSRPLTAPPEGKHQVLCPSVALLTTKTDAAEGPRNKLSPHDRVRVNQSVVDRQRQRLRVLEQQLEDFLAIQTSSQRLSAPKKNISERPQSATVACSFRVYCMTSRRRFHIPWKPHIKSAIDLKLAIELAEGIPTANQILIVSSGSQRVRLQDDQIVDKPTSTSSRIQLVVGESLQPTLPREGGS